MPLQKLQFKPGVNRESTSLANEGGWFESDKVRFRSGYPEKIGGWTKDTGTTTSTLQPPAGSFWGICRSLFGWLNLAGYNLLGLGTNLKYYIQNSIGGNFYDVTPLRETTAAGGVTFTATNGSNVILVTDPGHNAQTGDFVTFSGAISLGGNITADVLNREFQIAYVSSSTYNITVSATANASDVGNGGASVVGAYQVTTGSEIYTVGVGWGAGGWSGVTTGYASTGWGAPAPAGMGIGVQLRLWSSAAFGEQLIINPRNGAIYLWAVDANPNIFNRAQILSSTNLNTQNGIQYWNTDSSCPTVCGLVLVSDTSRFVIAFGCNDIGSSVQDKLLIRWSDQENYKVWYPQITNQAGSYRLSAGSKIITAIQTRQEILVFTDAALYSMQYIGPPYVWQLQIMGDNISIVSPNAVATANNVTYWMGVDKFYMYSGRVETLPCTLRQYIYDDINLDQSYQVFSGTNEGYNEIWWFYCSANSTTVDRYVIYNHLERTWAHGNLPRTAWKDSSLRQYPMAAGYNGQLIYHEDGNDDGTVNPPVPISAYIQSADFDIGDGHNFGFVWRLIPDITFDGSTINRPSAKFTVWPRQFPGTNYGPDGTPTVASTQNYQFQREYNVQQFTPQVYVRIRGRQMAFRVSSDELGTSWQLGASRIDIRPDGRK